MSGARPGSIPRAQRGAALFLGVVLLVLIGVSVVISIARPTNTQAERDRLTDQALAQAKVALIGYAVDVLLSSSRLGELPCPDTDNDGTGIIVATGLPENCDAQDKRLGRLPWKTLGLPDLRDGDGERLWYAVSVSFKRDALGHCVTPAASDCINSDSRGTISVAAANGTPVHRGDNPDPWIPSGAIAVIIAPGAPLTREGASNLQDRGAAGINVAANYLDKVPSGEDNADFVDGTINGFVHGPVRTGNTTFVNDRIAVITYEDLIPALQKRVVREVKLCLEEYAATPGNGGRYPWAADSSETALAAESAAAFLDKTDTRAGRIPDTLSQTNADSAGNMAAAWPVGTCALAASPDWWRNWKLHVFYAVADAYKPTSSGTAPACGSCLTINGQNGVVTNRPYLVVAGGKALATVGPGPGQIRTTLSGRANPASYLEGENVFGASTLDLFQLSAGSSVFNDIGAFQ